VKRRAFIGRGMAAILASRRAPAFCIALRNGMMRPSAPPTPPLPYDAEVEYLESTGTQWIDTGTTLKSYSQIDCDFIGLGLSNKAVFGCSNGSAYNSGAIELFWLESAVRTRFEVVAPASNSASQILAFSPSYSVGTLYSVRYNKDVFSLNGDSGTSNWYSDYVGTRNLYIFATNRGSASYNSDCKMFLFKISANGTLVRDFIPVRFTNELGQSEGAMYDKVSGRLFRNQGTGAFTYGPDKS